MVARLKLKGIDGRAHKAWNLRLNLTQHGETYQVRTCEGLMDCEEENRLSRYPAPRLGFRGGLGLGNCIGQNTRIFTRILRGYYEDIYEDTFVTSGISCLLWLKKSLHALIKIGNVLCRTEL